MGECERAERIHAHPLEEQKVKSADDSELVGAERQRVTPQYPYDADDNQAARALHDGGKNVLAAKQTTVEKS